MCEAEGGGVLGPASLVSSACLCKTRTHGGGMSYISGEHWDLESLREDFLRSVHLLTHRYGVYESPVEGRYRVPGYVTLSGKPLLRRRNTTDNRINSDIDSMLEIMNEKPLAVRLLNLRRTTVQRYANSMLHNRVLFLLNQLRHAA